MEFTEDEYLTVRRARSQSITLDGLYKKEIELIKQQTEEERQLRQQEDNMVNRLYNRVANRNQDIPVSYSFIQHNPILPPNFLTACDAATKSS